MRGGTTGLSGLFKSFADDVVERVRPYDILELYCKVDTAARRASKPELGPEIQPDQIGVNYTSKLSCPAIQALSSRLFQPFFLDISGSLSLNN